MQLHSFVEWFVSKAFQPLEGKEVSEVDDDCCFCCTSCSRSRLLALTFLRLTSLAFHRMPRAIPTWSRIACTMSILSGMWTYRICRPWTNRLGKRAERPSGLVSTAPVIETFILSSTSSIRPKAEASFRRSTVVSMPWTAFRSRHRVLDFPIDIPATVELSHQKLIYPFSGWNISLVDELNITGTARFKSTNAKERLHKVRTPSSSTSRSAAPLLCCSLSARHCSNRNRNVIHSVARRDFVSTRLHDN